MSIAKIEADTRTADITILDIRDRIDAITYSIAELSEIYSSEAEYSRFILGEHLQALRNELARRERLYAAGHNVADPYQEHHDQWLDLGRDVRQRINIIDLFETAGYPLAKAGWNGTRQAEEYAGACFCCGGRDRFRVWTAGPNGPGFWCRQCGIVGDAITAVRNLIPNCEHFYAAVAYLADMVGAALPTVADKESPPSHGHKTTNNVSRLGVRKLAVS